MNEYLGRSLSFGAPKFTDVFVEQGERDRFYRDSPLSPRGVRQAQSLLARSHDFVKDCEVIVTSPLTRALQTIEVGILPHVSSVDSDATPIVATPHAAERLYLISDVGKSRSTLEQTYPFVDFKTGFEGHNDEEEWWYKPAGDKYVEWRPTGKGQRYACPGEPEHSFDRRMQSLVSWLGKRPEQKIAVVCHWGVIDWMLDMDFDNCQWREVAYSSLRQHAMTSRPRTT